MFTDLMSRAPAAASVVKEPQSVEQTGLDLSFIADLALKIKRGDSIFKPRFSDSIYLIANSKRFAYEITRFDESGKVIRDDIK